MTLAADVANFLLSTDISISHAISNLDFTLDSIRIDPEGYHEMGHKIRQHAITVEAARSRSGSSALSAAYTPALNKLSVSPGINLTTSVVDQSTIIHEITHALVDYHRVATTEMVDEALAYIAGSIFALSRLTQLSSPDPRSQAIVAAAQNIVRANPSFLIPQRTVNLSSSDANVSQLLQAIRNHTIAYPNATHATNSDGISGGLINPWYLPRN